MYQHKLLPIMARYNHENGRRSPLFRLSPTPQADMESYIARLQSQEKTAVELAKTRKTFDKDDIISHCRDVNKNMLDEVADYFIKWHTEMPDVAVPFDFFFPKNDNNVVHDTDQITSELVQAIKSVLINALKPLAEKHKTQLIGIQEKVDQYFTEHPQAIEKTHHQKWETFKHKEIVAAHHYSDMKHVEERVWPHSKVETHSHAHNLMDYLKAKLNGEISNLNGNGKHFREKLLSTILE